MADAPRRPDPNDFPQAVAAPKSKRSIQLVWIIPLIAVLIGGWLAVKSILDKGPTIKLFFDTAEGLEAGKTKIKYKDVDIGLVNNVGFEPGTLRVVVSADLGKGTEPYLLDDARFWVARPRISGGTVSGLGTLLSGPYIAMDIGKSGKARRDFTALKEPPALTSGVPGREFVLQTNTLGSVDVGSPIYFRHLQAGLITAYELDKDGRGITIKAFVNAPYDKFVTGDTRFWHASGIDMTFDASGVKISTQSIVSILVGGLAFETPATYAEMPPAPPKTLFKLFPDRREALANPDLTGEKRVMVFRESVRGLAIGAPIDFRGIEIGHVTAIRVDRNLTDRSVNIVVEAETFTGRMSARDIKQQDVTDEQRKAFVAGLVANGLRAQLRTGNLLTGQLYIALDFFPDAPKAKLLANNTLDQEIPTIQTSLGELQQTIATVATKIDKFPLQEIGTDMRQTLQAATRMTEETTKVLQRVDSDITPQARDAIVEARKAISAAESALKPDSPLSQDARDAMQEIARTAAAFRVLADYLERHPETLISGKKEPKK